MFAYCENNPILYWDPDGHYSLTNFNCYAYAMGYSDRWLHPGKCNRNVAKFINGSMYLIKRSYAMPYSYSVEEVQKWVISDFGSKIVRKINSKSSKLKSGEYRVAMKLCQMVGPLRMGQKRPTYDFHFAKQDPKTKIWYDKPGRGKINKLDKFNPDRNWNGSIVYNSKTLYIAVKRKFWKN